MTISVTDLKELSPFLAVVVSILALTIGPFLAGRVARAQAIAAMRERWIYAFRDCLVELLTEFDVLHEAMPLEGLPAADDYSEIIKKLRMLTNRVRLMVNPEEPSYLALLTVIEETIKQLVSGIDDYNVFHELNDQVRLLAQECIRSEWKKIAP